MIPTEIYIHTGYASAYDEHLHKIPFLSISYIKLYVDYMLLMGYTPLHVKIVCPGDYEKIIEPYNQDYPDMPINKDIESIIFCKNGNTMAYDLKGEQIPLLQKSWFVLYLEFLEGQGIDPEKIEFILPAGIANAKKDKDGKWVWTFKEKY